MNRRKKFKENGTQLKNILADQKTKLIVNNFINKLRRNNINSTPVEYTPFLNELDVGFLDH